MIASMADKLSTERRSENMRRIRSSNTKPELHVRKALHSKGYRYRLHRRDLPGSPDLVFPGRRKVIFVHGCFWHGHEAEACPDRREVKSNKPYWGPKIAANKARDQRNEARLKDAGWDFIALWECELRDTEAWQARVVEFLGPAQQSSYVHDRSV